MAEEIQGLLAKQVGQTIAAVRRSRKITQVELGKKLGLTQSMIASYEIGRRGMPLARLVALAEALGVSCAELVESSSGKKGKRGPKSKLECQFELLQRLPRSEQQFVSKFLDQVLTTRSANSN